LAFCGAILLCSRTGLRKPDSEQCQESSNIAKLTAIDFSS
jgi:hypothetical protein